MTGNSPDFVSIQSFSEHTSLSVRTVERLLERREIPSIRVGRRRLIPLRAAIEALTQVGKPSESAPSKDS
jgi:excisionase family DNA binding protein